MLHLYRRFSYSSMSFSLSSQETSAFSRRGFSFVNNRVQVGVEEEKVVVFSAVLLVEAMLVEVHEKVIYGFDSS